MSSAAALCIHPSSGPAWQPSASHESAMGLIWARGWGSDVAAGGQNEFRLGGPWPTVHHHHHHHRCLFRLQTFDPPPTLLPVPHPPGPGHGAVRQRVSLSLEPWCLPTSCSTGHGCPSAGSYCQVHGQTSVEALLLLLINFHLTTATLIV